MVDKTKNENITKKGYIIQKINVKIEVEDLKYQNSRVKYLI